MKVNQVVIPLVVSNAIFFSVEISEVTYVSFFVKWSTVSLVVWVVVWTCGLASLNQIA